jgi:hypothetical protein
MRLVSVTVPTWRHSPFTASVDTQWVRQLSDGTTITLKNHRTIARDNAGRVFQERRQLVPDDGQHKSDITEIDILDPVAHLRYICYPDANTCHASQFNGMPASRPDDLPHVTTARKENLGSKDFDGFQATGTLEDGVISSGAIGNDTPISVTREFWYSPKLGFNLSSHRHDPRFGTQTFEVSNIVAGQPDPKLFQVPEGFKILREGVPPSLYHDNRDEPTR